MIEIKNLSHSLDKTSVLRDINLQIPDRTILGIVGITGAGKSTLRRLLAGVYLPDRGEILYDGRSPADAATRQDIFFLPDDPYFTTHSTPKSILRFYRALYPNIDCACFARMLEDYGIDLKGALRNFSKGMRRQVFVALAFAIHPKYLLLDESFDGLDVLSRKKFKAHVAEWMAKDGGTVLISSHSLKELTDVCDRFVLVDRQTLSPMETLAEQTKRCCRFLLSFSKPVEESAFADLPVIQLDLTGQFVQITLCGNAEEMSQRLRALSPAVMEEAEIDFEDAFLYDVTQKGGEEV